MGHSEFIQYEENNRLFTQIEHFDKFGKFLGHSTIWTDSNGKKIVYHFDDRPIHNGNIKYTDSTWTENDAYQYHPDNRGKKKKKTTAPKPIAKKEEPKSDFSKKFFVLLIIAGIGIWSYKNIDFTILLGVLFSLSCLILTGLAFYKYKVFHIISPLVCLLLLTELNVFSSVSTYYIEYLEYSSNTIHASFYVLNCIAALVSAIHYTKKWRKQAVSFMPSSSIFLRISFVFMIAISTIVSVNFFDINRTLGAGPYNPKEVIKEHDTTNYLTYSDLLTSLEDIADYLAYFFQEKVWDVISPPVLEFKEEHTNSPTQMSMDIKQSN